MAHTFASWALVAAVALAGLLLSRVVERAGISVMVLISMVGVVAGALLPGFVPSLGPAFLWVFLPALIFEAAWDAEPPALRRAAPAIAVLAVPGVILTACVVGAAAAAWGALPLIPALVLGSLVAATDPVSVLATFRRFALPVVLLTIVEGESVANDGVAYVLVQSLVPLGIPSAAHLNIPAILVAMLSVAGGGVLAGVIVALPLGLAMRARLGVLANVGFTLATAYVAYALAAALGISGIFAVAAAGITLRSVASTPSRGLLADDIDRTWDAIAFACNAGVFALVGMTLRLERLVQEPALIACVIVAVVGARLLLAYGLVPLRGLTGSEVSRRWRHVIALAGLRGGLSLVLALGLPAALPSRDAIRDAVFAVVFVTLILQGPLVGPLLRRAAPEWRTGATSAGA